MEPGQVKALCSFFGHSRDKLVVYRDCESDTEHDPLVFIQH